MRQLLVTNRRNMRKGRLKRCFRRGIRHPRLFYPPLGSKPLSSGYYRRRILPNPSIRYKRWISSKFPPHSAATEAEFLPEIFPILRPIQTVKNFFRGSFSGRRGTLGVESPSLLDFSQWQLLGLSTIDWRRCRKPIGAPSLHKSIVFGRKSDRRLRRPVLP